MLRLALVGAPPSVAGQIEAVGAAGITQVNLGGSLGRSGGGDQARRGEIIFASDPTGGDGGRPRPSAFGRGADHGTNLWQELQFRRPAYTVRPLRP